MGISKADWDAKFNRLITSSSIFGLCLGAVIATQIVSKGRRIFLIVFGLLAIVATALTLVLDFWVITIGRLLHGLCCGIFMAVAPRMLDETVPTHLISSFGVYTNIYANLGILATLMLGLGLPQGAEPTEEELLANDFWRVCYGMPIPLLIIGIILLLTTFRQDSINFHVLKYKAQVDSLLMGSAREIEAERAKSLIEKIYYDDSTEIFKRIVASTKSVSSGESQVTFWQSITDPEYRRATWFCFVLTLFHQNTGLNAINIYSNEMVRTLNKKGAGFPLTPTQATYFVGIFGFIGAMLGPPIISRLPRKLNFLYGHATMGVSMTLMAIFTI